MKAVILKICLVIFLTILPSFRSNAQVRNQIFVGARPQGLGETFTAIANDANAVYWNPAGLPTLKRKEFNGMYANLFNIQGLKNYYLSMVWPVTPRFTIGGSWFYYGYSSKDDEVLKYDRNKIHLSLGTKVIGKLTAGINLKYIDTGIHLDDFTAGSAWGVGFDCGLLYSVSMKKLKLLKNINFGLMVHDVAGTNLKYEDTGRSEEVFRQNIRFGVSIFAKENISLKWFSLNDALLAFDFDDRFHVGAEVWLLKILGLRAGLQKDFHTDQELTYSFGASLKLPSKIFSTQMDYGYLMPPVLASTNMFACSFSRSSSPVRIIKSRVNDLYASFYKTYAISPVGEASIRNEHNEKLDIIMKVSIPGLTERPVIQSFVLEPEEQQTNDFPIIFSKNVLNKKEPEFHQVQIRVEYRIHNEDRYEETFEKFKLYGRGAITWDDPGKAVAYITRLDQMVELFAREATKDLRYRTEIELGNIYTAAALFDAMGAIGIKYRSDPENPFAVISKSHNSVDNIQYPAELLTTKQGDCDDLTVLYASLLEYSGIKTALVTTAGHITLMLDTGIHERNWGVLPLQEDSLVVVANKTLWIPVEVTEVGNSFAKAWQTGGTWYRESEHDKDFKVVHVSDVAGIYISALPDEFQDQVPAKPDWNMLQKMLDADTTWVQQRRSNYTYNRYLAELQRNPGNDTLRNRLGIIYAQQDHIDEAKKHFKYIFNRNPNNFQALVNLANIYSISGKFEYAEEYYLRAKKLIEYEPGLYLDLAILYQLWKIVNPADSTLLQAKSEKNLFHAFKLLNGNEIMSLDLLAISTEDFSEKAGFWSRMKQQAATFKKFIKKNIQKYITQKSVKGARIELRGVKRGDDKDRSYILWWAYDRQENQP